MNNKLAVASFVFFAVLLASNQVMAYGFADSNHTETQGYQAFSSPGDGTGHNYRPWKKGRHQDWLDNHRPKHFEIEKVSSVPVPELDPAVSHSALLFLAGSVLVLVGRRRRSAVTGERE